MINYLIGDASNPPIEEDNVTIAHVVNNKGGWGAGFSGDVSLRFPYAKKEYKKWARGHLDKEFSLGSTQLVEINNLTTIANMLCQKDYIGPDNLRPFQFDHFYTCFDIVVAHAVVFGKSIHMPRVGCGLGGADWVDVEPIIEKVLSQYQTPPDVYIYGLKEN